MARVKIVPNNNQHELEHILEISGVNIKNCIQCAKCSAGCPASGSMDILPNEIIRLLHLGQLDKVRNSQSIWNCASCFTCTERCPRNIDLAKLIEAIRLTIIRQTGKSRLRADNIPEILDEKMPQQIIVSGFRKYNR